MSNDFLNGEKVEIAGFEFPKEITLTYGKEGVREWFEYWKGKKGLVIQKGNGNYFYIFFINGKVVRTYKTPDIKAYKTIEEAIKELKNLGFKVKVRV
jgi:hypothetical protein